jgi:hypothetical protein
MIVNLMLAQTDPPKTLQAADRLQVMSRHLRSRGEDNTLWWGLLGLAAIGAALYGMLLFMQWYQHRGETRRGVEPSRLFRDVLQSLDLPFADRVMLRRIVRGLNLAEPTTILISPSTLRWAAGRWAQQHAGRRRRQYETDRLADISRRIFGEPFEPIDESEFETAALEPERRNEPDTTPSARE